MQAPETQSSLLRAARAGRIVSGEYRLGELLGAGPCSIVVEAEHLASGRQLAMKLLEPEVVARSGGMERLADAIRVAAALTSPHAVKAFTAGVLDTGEPYVVMELVPGQSLARVVAERGPLPVPLAASYALQACRALSEAHEHGLVHGGLHLRNLLLADDGESGSAPRIKVADLGAGLELHEPPMSGEQQARDLAHASPEQITGRPIDVRTDVWALGIILFELVTGAPPFTGRNLRDVLSSGDTLISPQLRSVHGAVPSSLTALVQRCLSLDVDRRPARVQDVAAVLEPLAASGSLGSPATSKTDRIDRDAETHLRPPDSVTHVDFQPPYSALEAEAAAEAAAAAPPTLRSEPRLAAKPAGSAAKTLMSAGAQQKPITAPMAVATAALVDVASTAKLPPQVGALMRELLPAPGAPTPTQGASPPAQPSGTANATSAPRAAAAPTPPTAVPPGTFPPGSSALQITIPPGSAAAMSMSGAAMSMSGAAGAPMSMSGAPTSLPTQSPPMSAPRASGSRGALVAVALLVVLLAAAAAGYVVLAKRTAARTAGVTEAPATRAAPTASAR